MPRRFVAVLAALAIPGVALAAPVWKSDFESGSLDMWTRAQAVHADRLQIVSDPVRQGARALKVTVHQGDDPINSGNDRAELLYLTHEPKGSEYWYRWSVLFPEDYPYAERWQLFTQWHQQADGGVPPFELFVVGDEIRLRAGGGEAPLWTTPLQRGVWQDFLLHVKWSSDPNEGFVELFHDGELALPKTPTANQYPGQTNYLKMGLYRSREIAASASIYFDDVRMGADISDVVDLPAPDAVPTDPAASPAPGDPGDAPVGPISSDGLPPGFVGGPDVGCSATGGTSTGLTLLAGAAVALFAAASRRRKTVLARARAPAPRGR